MVSSSVPNVILHGAMVLNDKSAVVKALRDMGLLKQIKGENSFKTRAYDIAADRIAGLSDDIGELVQKGTLIDLPGIGESMAAKITELVTTGKIASLDELRAEFPPTMLELLRVPDLGPKKAKILHEELKIGSIEALEAACRAHQLRGLKGFGEKTEIKLLAGIEVAKRAATGSRRRLSQVLPKAQKLLEHLKLAPGVVRASLGGSVRRMRETVADVDMIVSAADPEPVFKQLTTMSDVAQVIGQGDSKASVRLYDKDGDLQVDLRVLPDEDFATALHHFSGSKAHHIRLRGLAIDRGLKISEWGVTRGEEKLKITTEDDIYALLQMQPVPPELREDWGEVEASLEGRLPQDLITPRDILGNVHAHTTWSDGRNSLEEMALAAKAMGLQYLTVTEHSQTAGYAGGLKEDDLKRQWDEIDAVNAKIKGLTLLKGIESDILEDGRLDYPDAFLEKLDVVICSIHQRHSQNEDQMTKRMLAAFDNPFFMIWGHPTGRLLLKREPAPMRMEEILDKAAERGITIEVNGGPERLDLSAEHVRLALQRNLKLVLSTDAHSVDELRDNLPYALGMARKGWARKSDVLNARPVREFKAALRAH
jgi:DNA polymerase (family 10)